MTSRALKAKGHHVEVADNGSLGLEKLTKNYDDFDLVLCDLQMPVMDGFEATRRFRKFENSKFDRKNSTSTDDDDSNVGSAPSGTNKFRLPIIGMSANSDSASKECAFTAGMDRFVPKPFTLGELLPIIEKMIPRNHNEPNVGTVLPIIDSSRHDSIRSLLPLIDIVNSEAGRHGGGNKKKNSEETSLETIAETRASARNIQMDGSEVYDIFGSDTSSEDEEGSTSRSRINSGAEGVGTGKRKSREVVEKGRTKSETIPDITRADDAVRKGGDETLRNLLSFLNFIVEIYLKEL